VAPSGESVYPQSVGRSPSVSVNGPAGNQTIANPLYSYQFKPLNPNDLPDAPVRILRCGPNGINVEYQFNQYPQTLRYPTTQDASAVSQNNLVAQQLDNNAASLRQRLYMLFTYYHDYTTFNNEAWIDSNNNPNGYDSIESVHDQIHGLTGNGGHMTYIDYSPLILSSGFIMLWSIDALLCGKSSIPIAMWLRNQLDTTLSPIL
jgi:tyrosinase